MNKLIKGSIAGAAGVALLLGGAGTFAVWNTSATLTGSTIASGNLAVIPDTTLGSWTVNGSADPIILVDYLIVPGDVLTYTKNMNILASGDNLVATLALSAISVTAATTSDADVALKAALDESVILTAKGTGIAPIAGAVNTYEITPAAGEVNQAVTVVATIEFPESGTAGAENAAMKGKVSLQNMTLNLTQTVVSDTTAG